MKKSTPQTSFLPAGFVLLLAASDPAPQGDDRRPADDPPSPASSLPERPLPAADRPLPESRQRLLELAFQAASAIPVDPHLKTRSREQEAVVAACLELDQPRRALLYSEKIGDWRRGACLADVAFHCAQNGHVTDAQRLVDRARQIAVSPADENEQAWRRDRIRVKIAKTCLWLGELDRAAEWEAGAEDLVAGELQALRAMRLAPEDFDALLSAVDRAVATGSFDKLRNAMESCASLFHRFYEDAERRARAERAIQACAKKMPATLRFEITMKLADVALDHLDVDNARALLEQGEHLLGGSFFDPEDLIPRIARMANVRHRAGDTESARRECDAARARFETERRRLIDIDRADVLRPLAEVYLAIGDRNEALKVYARALEEGVQNPNSRPRAEDLSSTCRSMALHGAEPDAELWARIHQIRDSLGDPW